MVSSVSAQRVEQQPVFRSGARLIVQTVSVKDKDGRAVEGLTPADFVVVEDGEPQTISFVEYQRLPDRPAEARAATPAPRFPADGQRAVADAGTDRHPAARRHALPRPPAARALFRSDRDAAGRSDARLRRRADVHRRADAAVGSDGDHDLRRRRRAREAGLHRRPRRAARGDPDADLRRRQGRRRHPRQHRYRHRLRPGRCGVQHPEHRPPAVGAADGGHDAAGAAGAEGADLLRERPAAERRRQSGAAAGDDQRRDPRQRGAAPDRRARPGRAGAARRRVEAVARRHRHVHRSAGAERRHQLPAVAGHALLAGQGHRRARDVRLQRPVARHRARRRSR